MSKRNQQPYFCVVGNPIQHSKSPLIHSMFGEQTGLDLCYVAIETHFDDFVSTVDDFRRAGGLGMNVTVPFKEQAWRLADEHSDRAIHAQAVNTLTLDGKHIYGDNTDGVGLVRDLEQNLGLQLQNATVLLLGAGGAVRGVLAPLLNAGVRSLTLANRTVQKAVDLARTFQPVGNITGGGYDDLPDSPFDLIINGTAASLAGQLPPLPASVFGDHTLAYDMMYGDRPTVFMEWAGANGAARVSDGLGMLVEQAAESYYVWNRVRPETRPVIEKLRQS
ncbi:MAG: shikimate dehydrogenase [Gammaproteobacteria bacterium]|nr:MAG: shikimate dehydrogenase [Gammaproteobacteria bacterium]